MATRCARSRRFKPPRPISLASWSTSSPAPCPRRRPGGKRPRPTARRSNSIGGGITVTRGFQKGEAALNASLLVDNPAVANILALFQPGNGAPAGDSGWRIVNIGGESALLRFDAANREGEIEMVIAGRAALQVEGSEIAADQILIDLAQGWNLPALKKLLGA